jgi:protein ImuA
MPLPAASEMRSRATVMEDLRRLLPGVAEGLRTPLPFGLAALDSHLPEGGLVCGALHEVVPETGGATPAAFGFIAAMLARLSSPPPERGRSTAQRVRPEVAGPKADSGRRVGVHDCRGFAWVRDPSPPPLSGEGEVFVFVMPAYGLRHLGRLYGHGLRALGLDPARLILVETTHRNETLWAMEEALHSAAPAAVAGVVDKLDLKLSQRLHLAATDAGLPLLLLRPAATLEASAAATRWRVGTAEAARDRFGLYARPRWHLQLERARNGRPGEWVVEYDHVAHRFSLAAALADPAHARGAGKKPIKQAS